MWLPITRRLANEVGAPGKRRNDFLLDGWPQQP